MLQYENYPREKHLRDRMERTVKDFFDMEVALNEEHGEGGSFEDLAYAPVICAKLSLMMVRQMLDLITSHTVEGLEFPEVQWLCVNMMRSMLEEHRKNMDAAVEIWASAATDMVDDLSELLKESAETG